MPSLKGIIIFDLDETLVDTTEHVVRSTYRTFLAHGRDIDIDDLRTHFKRGRFREFREKHSMPNEFFYGSPEGVHKHRVPMKESVDNGHVEMLRGADRLLHDAASHYAIAIVTNTDEGETREKTRLLGIEYDKAGPSYFIRAIVPTHPDLPRKPDVAPMIEALRRIDLPESAPLYVVGDLDTDMECGRRLRALGYNVTTILINHFSDEYDHHNGERDITVRSIDELRKELSLK